MSIRLSLAEINRLSLEALLGSGADRRNAEPVARSIEDAEAEGIPNVGLSYLTHYCEDLRRGRINGKAIQNVEQITSAAIRVDGDYGFAHAAFIAAESAFLASVENAGFACLAIRHSYMAGVVGWFVDRLARRGLVALAFGNSPSMVAPFGGKRRFFGTNPMAFAAPRASAPPLVVDLSTSVTARVNVVQAAAAGGPIPEGWALDEDGRPTTDPARALAGTVAPLGGYKGTCLAIMVDVLAAGLTGSNWAHEAEVIRADPGGPPGVGQMLLAFSPDRLGAPALAGRLEKMLAAMCADEGVRIPGDRRHAHRLQAERDGIVVASSLHQKLVNYAG
ncbi:MAG: Ldh family oxidoreductase [Proteobacteria bacterium]|nr:Ldh family oxidoreductase [Pseudomonadota bacterium]MBI3496257.1 Ldh family oxidoreductase [Pseudomonadota bacterium]